MPTPLRQAQYRRDEARWRTRRLSWFAGGGAATASVALGAVFAQLLPGHTAAASTSSGSRAAPQSATASAPASKASTAPTAASKHRARRQRSAASQPAAPPAPSQAPPVVVSGGS